MVMYGVCLSGRVHIWRFFSVVVSSSEWVGHYEFSLCNVFRLEIKICAKRIEMNTASIPESINERALKLVHDDSYKYHNNNNNNNDNNCRVERTKWRVSCVGPSLAYRKCYKSEQELRKQLSFFHLSPRIITK